MTPNTFRRAWLRSRTARAMRVILATPEMTVPREGWVAFWAAYSSGTTTDRRSPATFFEEEQVAAAEAALEAATAGSAGVRMAVSRTFTADYWLAVYGAAEWERVARRQARYLTALAAPGWSPEPAWRTSDVVGVTRWIVETGNFSKMPILADALQDGGCDDDEWLRTMRDPGQPWFVGCRVLDALC